MRRAVSDYNRIAQAISFIATQVHDQPNLQDIAAHLHMSPFHFQRMFSRWTGITPKRFLQALTLDHAKQLLNQRKSLLDVSDAIGLSSASRLYDHFVQLEAITPGEYKRGGQDLVLEHAVHDSPFGKVFIAVTPRGICQLAFIDGQDSRQPLADLHQQWPRATLRHNRHSTRLIIDTMFDRIKDPDRPLSLHVWGTNFQINVWRALLQIPQGALTTYADVAAAIGHPRSARAVGNAIAANPIAFLIPCHRVIQQCGKLGGYRWGETRKHAMQIWEAARNRPSV